MSSYLVMENGEKQHIDDDLFDLMWNTLKEETSMLDTKTNKQKLNDKLNAKYRKEGYFKEYFKNNNKSYECEKCGLMISSKTNKAKHQNTARCKTISEEKQQKELMDKITRKVLLWN